MKERKADYCSSANKNYCGENKKIGGKTHYE